jgi:hypothetical protein
LEEVEQEEAKAKAAGASKPDEKPSDKPTASVEKSVGAGEPQAERKTEN